MKYDKGYTLIELLVGITIIGLLFGFGFVSFRDFSRRQALSSAVKTIIGDLRLAQAMAGAGKKPDHAFCRTPAFLENYTISFTAAGYSVVADCSGGNVRIKNVNVPSGITLTLPSPNPIIFRVLGNGTNANNVDAGMSPTEIILRQANTGKTGTVVVTSSGDIY